MIQLWLGFGEIKGALFAFVRAEVTNASGEPPRGKSTVRLATTWGIFGGLLLDDCHHPTILVHSSETPPSLRPLTLGNSDVTGVILRTVFFKLTDLYEIW